MQQAQGFTISDRITTLMLVGKTGHGKTSLAGAILPNERLQPRRGFVSGSADSLCTVGQAMGRNIAVIDTLGDKDVHNRSFLTWISKAITFCPHGIDAFILVINVNSRFCQEDIDVVEYLKRIFDPNFLMYCIIVFSHGDAYDSDQSFEDALMRDREKQEVTYLNSLLNSCNNRYILMDNSENCNREIQERKVSALLEMVDVLKAERSARYTNRCTIHVQSRIRDLGNRYNPGQTEKEVEGMLIQDGKCFPADGVVQTPNGAMRMDELSVGQSVLCMHNNKLTYSTVYMWGHRDHTSWSNSFVTLTTDTAQLTLTSDHLMLIIDEMGDEVSVAAGDVCAGQTVQVLHHVMSDAACLKHEKVVAVEKCVMRRGLFAPFTMEGNLVVNGVLASCYINCLPHAVSHGLLWPVRFSWRLVPSVVDAFNELGDDGMPSWVSWVSKRILPRCNWLHDDGISRWVKTIQM